MIINTNITTLTGLNANRQAGNSLAMLAQRLSSGLRINRAADDPSGLGIATSLQAQISGTEASLLNAQDAKSMIAVMDSGLDQIQSMLMRIRDLSVAAANEATLRTDCQDRTRIQREIESLIAEIDRTAYSTTFNTKEILMGDIPLTYSAGVATTISPGGVTSMKPDWGDNTTVVMQADVTNAALRPAAFAASTQERIVTVNIAAPGVATQRTSEPTLFTDADADLYYDNGAGVNDPLPNNATFPLGVDADGDGWRVGIDNNDVAPNGTKETVTGSTLAPAATATKTYNAATTNALTFTLNGTSGITLDSFTINGPAQNYNLDVDFGAGYAAYAVGVTGNNNYALAPDTKVLGVRAWLRDPSVDATGQFSLSATDNPGAVGSTGNVVAGMNNTFSFANAADMDQMTVTANPGTSYDVYYKQGAGAYALLGSYSDLTPQPINFGNIVADTIQFRVTAGISGADITAATFANTAADNYAPGGAASQYYTPAQPDNAKEYDVSAMYLNKIDRIDFTVQAGMNYSLEYQFGGGAWTVLSAGTGAAVSPIFPLTGPVGNQTEIIADKIRLYSTDAWVTPGAGTAVTSVTNRTDRDLDGWADVIESGGPLGLLSNPDLNTSTPSGLAGPAFSTDNDGDGYKDVPGYYDNWYVGGAAGIAYAAGSNPVGFTPGAGTGNVLLTAVTNSQLPTTTDTDQDTIPNPLDPFAVAEFLTWTDLDPTWKGGNYYMASNRFSPNTANYDLVMRDAAGTYTQMTFTGNVTNPQISPKGTALAWEQGASIWATYLTTDCAGTVQASSQIVAVGDNPAWSPDDSQVIFNNGTGIYVHDMKTGNDTQLLDAFGAALSGSNPTWTNSNDFITYTKAADGNIWAFSIPFQTEFMMTAGGGATEAAVSPDGQHIAYTKGGTSVEYADISITYLAQPIHIGPDSSHYLDFDLLDARASTLGVSAINVLQINTGAWAGITAANDAIQMVSDYRAQIGMTDKRLNYVINDLNVSRIQLSAAKSAIMDTDMAATMAEYVKSKILTDSSQAAVAQANAMPSSVLRLIEQNRSFASGLNRRH